MNDYITNWKLFDTLESVSIDILYENVPLEILFRELFRVIEILSQPNITDLLFLECFTLKSDILTSIKIKTNGVGL